MLSKNAFLMLILVSAIGGVVLLVEGGAPKHTHETAMAKYEAYDFAEAFKIWEKLADNGDLQAQYWTGFMYNNGYGVPEDPIKARTWWESAAAGGNHKASYALTVLQEFEGSVQATSDLDRLLPLAEEGDPHAQHALGWLFETGEEVSKDLVKSFGWYLKAAQQGHAASRVHVAFAYASGNGVSRDYREAAKWYEVAARAGDQNAQYNLGYMYREGLGASADLKLAAYWLGKAAAGADALIQSKAGNAIRTFSTPNAPEREISGLMN